MNIDENLIKDVAKNARLKLSKEEIKEFLPQLKEVLIAFSKLDEVRTKDTDSSFQPIKIKNVYREDKPCKCLSQEEALSNTKHKKDGYFKGPKII